MRRPNERPGGVIAYVIVGVVLLALLLGGIYLAKHQARLARDNGGQSPTIGQSQSDETTDDTSSDQSADQSDGEGSDQSSQPTDDAADQSTEGTTDGQSSNQDGQQSAGDASDDDIARTGPDQIAATGAEPVLAAAAGLTASSLAYWRSRRQLNRLG